MTTVADSCLENNPSPGRSRRVAGRPPAVLQRLGGGHPVRRAPVRHAHRRRGGQARPRPRDGRERSDAPRDAPRAGDRRLVERRARPRRRTSPTCCTSGARSMATLDRRIVGNDTDAVEIKSTAKYVSRPERYWWWQCQAQCYCRRPRAGPPRRARRLDEPGDLRRRAGRRGDRPARATGQRGDGLRRGRPVAALGAPHRRGAATHRPQSSSSTTTPPSTSPPGSPCGTSSHDLERLEAAHKAALVEALGDAQAATIDGRPVLTYRSHTRTNIDLTRLRAEHAELAAELSVEQIVRVLRPVRVAGESGRRTIRRLDEPLRDNEP